MLFFLGATTQVRSAEESLPALKDGKAPQTYDDLWAGFDPRAEPLDIEVLKEWEQEGVVLRVVRYRIGIFKGRKTMMAAIYGFPKAGTRLPGLVQIHGGGQSADANAILTNAKRGYATISIAWAGRISAPGYMVNGEVVKLFWDGKTSDPNYKLTTDWGALDAYHAPCRNEKNFFAATAFAAWTLDSVESPRNNPWFLCTLGARRALTFLEQQPEVNPEKLGVYGHSMGGKLTVMTAAADPRVKAAAPSCGGLSDRTSASPLYCATINDEVSLKRISCPIIFLSPSNDFHGRIDDLQKALGEIKSKDWRVTCSPHSNHQDLPEYEVAGPLWFDEFLKGTFEYPQTPGGSLELKTAGGIPSFTANPDASKTVVSVDIYYTQQGQKEGEKDDMQNTKCRFWHYSPAIRDGTIWRADLPLVDTGRPLWAYANVGYRLDGPVTGAGYYYSVYTTDRFSLSSRMRVATAEQLQAAGVKATVKRSLVIETFGKDWQKEWFTYDTTDSWARTTHKLHDPQWQAPAAAKLVLDVRAEQANKLVVSVDNHAAEVALKGGHEWQNIVLSPADFRDADGSPLRDWKDIGELKLDTKAKLRGKKSSATKTVGGDWHGAKPEFRNLRWAESPAP